MSEFYKRNPGLWMTGTDDLTLEQEAAYSRVIDATHLYDHPVRNNLRVLAGLWRCNERKAKRLLAELIALGKLTIDGAFIVNRKAMEDLSNRNETRIHRQSAGRRGGIESGKTRANPADNKETGEASASTRREENRREEKRDTPPPPKGDDVRAKHPWMFDEFWASYPKRVERKGAEKKFWAAVKSGVDPGRIVEAAQRYAESEQVRRGYAKNPTTWLNNGCWDDEQQQPTKGKTDDFASLMAFADRFDQRREAERQVDSGEGSGPSRPLLPGGDGPGSSSADARGLDRGPGRPAAGGHRDSDYGMAPVVWFTAKAR